MLKRTPSYHLREGGGQAIVTRSDFVTKRRHDFQLGIHCSPPSRECYHRLTAEWEANGQRLPSPNVDRSIAEAPDDWTINGVIQLRCRRS
jgi:hypothetical protein